MQIILITLSYAESANNLQIILTIGLTPLKMDELFRFAKLVRNNPFEKNRLADSFRQSLLTHYRFNKLPTYRNSSFADVEL